MDPIAQHLGKALLLDTNLTVLLVVGSHGRRWIERFNRTRSFTADDFDLVLGLVARFSRKITTPNILTEVDNLSRQLPRSEHAAIGRIMRRLIAHSVECYVPAQAAGQNPRFADLGLADCVTIACLENALLITGDARLYGIAVKQGGTAINFHHLRSI